MAQQFKISFVGKVGDHNWIGSSVKMEERLFWALFDGKIHQITSDQPDKYDQAHKTAKEAVLSQRGSLTVIDTAFEIKGKP